MLPLNKPLINYNNDQVDFGKFIEQYFPNRHYHLTFSARQGLSEIYQQIKQEKGRQNVAVSPLTCVEAIYPIIEHGHHVHFVDINPETFNMDETKIPSNMDVVQAIHLGGNPQDMKLISNSNPSIIVEDCAQGFGSLFKEKHVGLFGTYASFSFMKNIYSLGGGLLISNKNLIDYSQYYKKFGSILTYYRYLKRYLEINSSYKNNISNLLLKLILKLKPDNTTPVLNSSSINNTIARSINIQLSNYTSIINTRIVKAEYILNNISTPELIPQKINPNGKSNFLRLFFKTKSMDTKKAIAYLRNYGIGANHLTQNFSTPYQARFDRNNYLKKYINIKKLLNYSFLHDRIISIPISPNLTNKEMDYIIDKINKL